eukprot:7391990-Prymnesium_polylepis.4
MRARFPRRPHRRRLLGRLGGAPRRLSQARRLTLEAKLRHLVLALPPHRSHILHGVNRDLVDRCGSGASVGVGVVRLVTPRRGTAHVRKEVVHDALCCLGALPARGQRTAAARQVLRKNDAVTTTLIPQQAALLQLLRQRCEAEPRRGVEGGACQPKLLPRALVRRWRLARTPAVVREAAIGPPHVQVNHDGRGHAIEHKVDTPLAAQAQVCAKRDARTHHRLHHIRCHVCGWREVAQVGCATWREELISDNGNVRTHHINRRGRLAGFAHHLLQNGFFLRPHRRDSEAAVLRSAARVTAHLGHDAVQIRDRRIEAHAVTTRSGGGLEHERHGGIDGFQPLPRLEQLLRRLAAKASGAAHVRADDGVGIQVAEATEVEGLGNAAGALVGVHGVERVDLSSARTVLVQHHEQRSIGRVQAVEQTQAS